MERGEGDSRMNIDEKLIHSLYITQAQGFIFNTQNSREWLPLHEDFIPTSILYDTTRGIYRVISVDSNCKDVIINSTILPNFEFVKTSDRFGHWTDYYSSKVFGIGFNGEAEMNKFIKFLNMAKSAILSGTPVNALSLGQLDKKERPPVVKTKKNVDENNNNHFSSTTVDMSSKESQQLNKNLLKLLQQASARTDAVDVILAPPQERNLTATLRKEPSHASHDKTEKKVNKGSHKSRRRNHLDRDRDHEVKCQGQAVLQVQPPVNLACRIVIPTEEPSEWRHRNPPSPKFQIQTEPMRHNEINNNNNYNQDMRPTQAPGPILIPNIDQDENGLYEKIDRLHKKVSWMYEEFMGCYNTHKRWQDKMKDLFANKSEMIKSLNELTTSIENKKQSEAYAIRQNQPLPRDTIIGSRMFEEKFQALLSANVRLEELVMNLTLNPSIQASLDSTSRIGCSQQESELENHYKELLKNTKNMLNEALGANRQGVSSVGQVDELFCKTINELKNIHSQFREAYRCTNNNNNNM